MPVYRYKETDPVSDVLRNRLTGSPASITASPNRIVDVDIDASEKADLDEQMAALGYDFVEESPTDSPRDLIRQLLGIGGGPPP